ncbi:MAG: hypothetical protein HZA66_22285 [Rhodopseudomonas palustris]|uniref:DUF2946 domain-containing protein n=1 Tax=Rhodopseudomonas palustris TaxID=1076 RepID=A0A933S1H1_RHOPL|nr:hypothetical protein [Rhodopseudomonas palustris]
MFGWLRRHSGIRRTVGVIVGQLFALQLLLAGVVATQMAAAEASGLPAICSSSAAPTSDGSDHSKSPIHHVACPICAFASLAGSLPDAAAAAVLRTALDAGPSGASITTIGDADRFEPRSSQGPPQAV